MKKIFTLLIFSWLVLDLNAQDIHFSQFYASPLTLNPAMTGKIPSKYRIAGNYRNQWGAVSVPFVTFSGSFDMPFLMKQMNKSFFGAGLIVISDKSGTAALANQSIYLCFAYHQAIDDRHHMYHKNPRHYLSIGARAGMVQKSVDINKLVFASQYDPTSKTFSNFSLEKFASSGTFSYADFDGGIMWTSYLNDMFSIYGGATMHHITQPKETFLVINNNTTSPTLLNRRYTLHAGAKIGLNEKIFVNPSVLFLSQTQASEFNLGASMSFLLSDEKKNPAAFYVGAYYRLGDAAVAMMGYEIHATRVGISYDFNLSTLKTASSARGGFELSLVHEGNPSTAPRKVIYCPRF